MVITQQKINIAELDLCRFTCLRCKATAEVTVATLDKHFHECRCPFCKESYVPGGALSPNPFEKLQAAIRTIQESDNVSMEFVVFGSGETIP